MIFYRLVLAFTLIFPVLSWFLITRHVIEVSILEYSIHEFWAKLYIGLAHYRFEVVSFCVAGTIAAALIASYRDWIERNWQAFLNAMILMLLIGTAVFGMKHELSIDEWEHVHSSWNVYSGKRPYIDFFQHHHGLMWYLLAPAIGFLDNHSSVLLFARLISLLFWLVTLVAVYQTSLLLTENKTTSKFALLLLNTCYICTITAIEYRPDNPQVAFGALALYFFFRYRRDGHLTNMVVSGISIGISFLFLQKVLIFLFPFGLYQLYLMFTRRIPVTAVAAFTGACFIPVLPFVAIYVYSGHFGEYLFFNWVQNLYKVPSEDVWEYLIPLFLISPFFTILAAASLFFLVFRIRTIPVEMTALALIAITIIILNSMQPKPYRQYFQAVWPVAAIFVGFFINECFGKHHKYKQAIVTLYVVGLSTGILFISAFSESNRNQLYLVDYLQQNEITENYAVDEYLRHSAFAKDMHFFWYSLNVNSNYDTYQKLIQREPYKSMVKTHYNDYDFCRLVATKRPKYIFMYNPVVEDLFRCDKEVIDRYQLGPWEGLYQIKDGFSGTD